MQKVLQNFRVFKSWWQCYNDNSEGNLTAIWDEFKKFGFAAHGQFLRPWMTF